MSYRLEGDLLEVCNCDVLCPCWIGEDPDNGTYDSVMGYNVRSGTIDGVDVSGRTVALSVHIPGNVLAGNWKVAMFVDDKASQPQADALVAAFSGKLGGPLADTASLIGEVAAVERASITFDVQEGMGTLIIGDVAECVMEPYRGPTGQVTTLNESIFTTIPGAPAWVSKASKYVRKASRFGMKDMDLQNHNAIQGSFRFEAN
ncbi:MAG TPA: DUF1326 domain-containing protein [Dehalococcoidia bacterium]|nr:DUF1326 domain-containing protein [Dehalococcoidia bacterium]